MYRRRVLYNNVHTYPPCHYHNHGVTVCSSHECVEPVCVPSHCHHHHHHHQCVSYPCYECVPQPIVSLLPIVRTSVHSDVYYHYDCPDMIYEDMYGYPYRLSRSKMKLVDVEPGGYQVETYRTRDTVPDKIIIPRSKVVRHQSLPPYERTKPTRIIPLYHSAGPNSYYLRTSRR